PARVLQPRGQEQVFQLLGRPVPAPVLVHLIIDTGAKRSSLVPGVINHLQPAYQGSARVETSGRTLRTSLFWVRLEFPDTSLEPSPLLAVARLDMPASLRSCHGVIGRDLLHRWESLLWQGRRGRFTIRETPGGLFSWFRR